MENEKKKKNVYKVEKIVPVRNWKNKIIKINFMNLFGYEVRNYFFKVLQCKTEENLIK